MSILDGHGVLLGCHRGAAGSEYRLALDEPTSLTSGEEARRFPLREVGSSSAAVAATASEQEPVKGSPVGRDGSGSTSSNPVALELSYVNVSNVPFRLFDPVLLQEC